MTANCYIGHQKTSDLFLVSCQCEVAILKDLVTLLRLMGPAIGLNACVLHSRVTLNIQQGDVVDSCVCPCILSHICVNPYILPYTYVYYTVYKQGWWSFNVDHKYNPILSEWNFYCNWHMWHMSEMAENHQKR